jgi:hypothetical protein
MFKLLLDLYRVKKGNITKVCEAANISRATFSNYLNDYPKFRADKEAIDESFIDFTEDELDILVHGARFMQLESKDVVIKNNDGSESVVTLKHEIKRQLPPDNAAVFFKLKCKAQKRGYIEKQQIDMKTEETRIHIYLPKKVEVDEFN